MSRDIKQLISQMTLEEKASLCSGSSFWDTKAVDRLGIPSVMVSDGPHGLRKMNKDGTTITTVCFPAACATASSFDTELLEEVGDTLGQQCRAQNVSVLLDPAMNIKRSPLCGRNFEYISEDPYLSGKIAAAHIRGVQKWNVGTSVKHFACNNQEYFRMSVPIFSVSRKHSYWEIVFLMMLVFYSISDFISIHYEFIFYVDSEGYYHHSDFYNIYVFAFILSGIYFFKKIYYNI